MNSPVQDDRGGPVPEPGSRSQLLTTRSVPAQESLEFWHDAVFGSLVGMDIRTETGTYDATMRTGQVGDLRVTTVDCDPGEVHRAPRFIARGDGGHVFVALQCSGLAQVEQDGRRMELGAGDFAFFETIRPFTTRFPERFQMRILSVPRGLLDRSEAELSELTARPVRPSDRLGGLVSPFLSRLAETLDGAGPTTAQALAHGAADLLAATAADLLGRRLDLLPGADRVMLLRVQRYLRWNLADPGLSPAVVARAHGISVRYLHRLFEGEGRTLCQWIRDARLRECRRALLGAPTDAAGVARIARRWGFSSGAQLSRAFRAAHGVSPTDWLRRERERRAACGPSGATAP